MRKQAAAVVMAGSPGEAFQTATTQVARWLEEKYDRNPAQAASVLGTSGIPESTSLRSPFPGRDGHS